jgi:amino acid permease
MSLIAQRADDSNAEGSFGFWTSVAFTCNYIVGTGFLTLPYAFHSAGYGLSFLVLLFLGGMSVISVALILVAMARAETYVNLRRYGTQRGTDYGILSSSDSTTPNPIIESSSQKSNQANGSYLSISPTDDGDGDGDEEFSSQVELTSRDKKHEMYGKHSNDTDGDNVGDINDVGQLTCPMMVGERKFEIGELCAMFMGRRFAQFYTVVVSVYMYGCLWVFSAVFGKALAYHLTIGDNVEWSYAFYLVLFAAIVVPLSCMELTEQIAMQVTLAAMRIVMMVAMLGTLLPSLLNKDITRPFIDENSDVLDDGGSSVMMRIENIHHIIAIGAYAFIFHHSVPALSHPVVDKKQLLPIFGTTIGFCFIGYSMLGIVLSIYFGDHLEQAANLNWSDYVGSRHLEPTLVSEAIAAFVVLFPALDVASAFPLNAITLGNSLMAAAYSNPSEYQIARKDRFIVSTYRIAASAPPIIAAGIVRDLGSLTAWTGLSGLLLVFVFPPLICLASSETFKLLGMHGYTWYHSTFTSNYGVYTTLFLGIVVSLYCCWCLAAHPPIDEGET